MALKPDGRDWIVKEQIIEDEASGLTIQFKIMRDGCPRLLISGEPLPFGNREIIFDDGGHEAGAGTATTGLCHASWINEVS